jgi:hypothetical protein
MGTYMVSTASPMQPRKNATAPVLLSASVVTTGTVSIPAVPQVSGHAQKVVFTPSDQSVVARQDAVRPSQPPVEAPYDSALLGYPKVSSEPEGEVSVAEAAPRPSFEARRPLNSEFYPAASRNRSDSSPGEPARQQFVMYRRSDERASRPVVLMLGVGF